MVAVLVAIATMSGCGGSSAPRATQQTLSLSRADLIHQGDVICAERLGTMAALRDLSPQGADGR